MKILRLCLLLWCAAVQAQTRTEFYCDNATSGTSNLWAGSTLTAAPVYHSGAGTWNGTSTFTPTDGSTPASTVSAGMWASVYTNGVVMAGYIAQVTGVAGGANGVITLSTTAFGGTAPGASTVNIAVGGCWHGPGTAGVVGGSGGATNYFPASFISQAMTNGANQVPRVNLRGGTSYGVTNTLTQSSAGPIIWEGFTNTAGDGGFATIDGGLGAANSYTLVTASGAANLYKRIYFRNNGSTSSGTGIGINATANSAFEQCGFFNMRSHGITAGSGNYLDECEFATNNGAGIRMAGSGVQIRNCNFHDNVQYGVIGDSSGAIWKSSIYRNGLSGITITTAGSYQIVNNTIVSNQIAGIQLNVTPLAVDIVNNIIMNNHGAGITNTANTRPIGRIVNCVFGSNVNGDLAANVTSSMFTNNLIFYASGFPYVSDTNGNFTLTSSSLAKSAGRGVWLQTTVNSPTNTVAFPDIGAVQSSDTNSTASGGAYTFAQ